MTTSAVLAVEGGGHVATVWLDSPERGNAMGPAFWEELPAAMGRLAEDEEVRAVVLAARGPHFSVGVDLATVGETLAPGRDGESAAGRGARLHRLITRLQRSISSVADCPKPVVAAVHGWCIGSGVDLATACDVRLASADARFSVRETRMALVADLGTLQRLPAIVGRGHTAELAYTGTDVDAERAGRIGLVNHVLPDRDGLHRAAGELAASIAANSPLAVQSTKRVLRAGEDGEVAQGLAYAAACNAALLQSHDVAEAMAAFLEKRAPVFRGD